MMTMGLGLVLGVLWAVVFLPRAIVVMSPSVTEQTVEREIILSTNAKEADYVKYILPAKQVDKEYEENLKIERSNAGAREAEAKGVVVLKNDQGEEQPLLPQTHLRHEASGVFFLTDRAVRIPVQGEIEVPVTAKEPGKQGNVPPGRFVIDKLPAGMQTIVYGESKTAFTGGVITDSPISEAELNQALVETEGKAREKARGLITAEAGGAFVRDELIKTEVVEQSSSASVGSKVPEFEVKTVVRTRGFVVDEGDLLSLTLLNLRAQPNSEKELVSYEPDSFRVEIARADFERGEARIKGKLTGLFAQKSSLGTVDVKKLAGRNEAEVQEYFKKFDDIGNVKVELWPFWVRSVPSKESAIRIELKPVK
jgi:hypothetical protein